ncbi:MAG: PVC-type heme-binding CxxCH protein, partial [Planctomycetota bacterium]|jgi:putative membrane-bound dehydrogenase-like protein
MRISIGCCLVTFSLSLQLAFAQEDTRPDSLRSIESTRGGRHWVDAKTQPPKSPEESLKAFQVEPGVHIELFAAEPLVMDPVAIAFDELGRAFVVEYGDYPIGPEDGGDPLSRVVVLLDTDDDGRADKRHVFADRLTFAHSLLPWNGGILVGAQTQLLFLKDTNGDFKADERTVLYDGFTPAHPQMQIGNPRWGFDNWIYCNYGPGKITSPQQPGKELQMPRSEFRFNPLTGEFGPAAGLGQFGNTVDNYGNRFFCTNRNPIMTSLLPLDVVRRNPFAVISDPKYDVAKSGGDTRVYPLVEMKSNYLSHAGTHTSACGVTAYHGDRFGGDFDRSVFVCEPIGHLVTRSIVGASGARLTADRAREKADFLASSDTWFRPASLATGPDGALYLADMYRLWVEHPKFLPPEIAEKLDWRAGEDRGRIWKMYRNGTAPESYTPPKSTDETVALLKDTNGWRRQLGQRLLVERQDSSAVPALRKLLTSHDRELTRLHAMRTLQGLSELSDQDLLGRLGDDSAEVQRHAARIAGERLAEAYNPVFSTVLCALASHSNAQVRFEAAVALGHSNNEASTRALAKLALRDGADTSIATAMLTSVKERSGAVLTGILKSANRPVALGLVRDLATVTGARGDVAELKTVLALFDDKEVRVPGGDGWKSAVVTGLATGLPRHRGSLGRVSLASLLNNPPTDIAESLNGIQTVLAQAAVTSLSSKAATTDRTAAIELLGYQPFAQTESTIRKLLTSEQPGAIQQAAINALQRSGGAAAAEVVLEQWPSLGPDVRSSGLALLLRRADSTLATLHAMRDGDVNPAVVDIDRRVRLMKHSNQEIRNLSAKLFGGAVSENRREVADNYGASLKLKGDAGRGEAVFKRVCSKCHRINGQGHQVGPDISDVRNRSFEALLFDILDPNSKVEPRFTDYAVITNDGRVFNGLMVSESSEVVVLRQAENKEQIIPRSDIDELRSTTKSLMPEGVEKEVTIEQMADLLTFLKGTSPQR